MGGSRIIIILERKRDMQTLLSMYVTLMPAILAGVINMIWCKLPLLKALKVPMDFGKTLSDRNRLFGDNKTWHGFIGYLFLNPLMSVLWGASLCERKLEEYNLFYHYHNNDFAFNLWIGLLLGLGYALFELPNSFIKRRLNISPGKSISGCKRPFFVFLDQADSVIGCTLVVSIFYPIGWELFFGFILVGAFTHIILNMILYFFDLRENIF